MTSETLSVLTGLCEIPQLFKEIMKKCWNFEPLNCPTAEELKSKLNKCRYDNDDEKI
ncbi:hypothetical protein Glove_395g36 [Diversispora epigaea]|uniref:Serine-threonine/tyrosine-protein kinase catalytic domain-containing protein n=1 Tax=Diversispora epigaea TaxID=1348612 RepID=A0A397H6G9_9GLOM|nr:hypothetical protein Glove_395g36 [Diversispora epigaea]